MTKISTLGKGKTMISPEEAWKVIGDSIGRLKPEWKAITESSGSVLAASVKAPFDLPGFDNSAMDGFAIRHADFKAGISTYRIAGFAPAGKTKRTNSLKKGEAFRIFTGAQIPRGADTVVAREFVKENKDEIEIGLSKLNKGAHIRIRGSQLRKGALALQKGHVLGAASIGFLANMGIQKVSVGKKPRVALIITGDELQRPGKKLLPGQIYESNSFALLAVLKQIDIEPISLDQVIDKEHLVIIAIKKALRNVDLILLTGGISAGDYDFVKTALPKTGVRCLFYKLAQKPGKPLFYGLRNKTAVFALPGNPASVLSCFYEYVYPAIRMMGGFENPFLEKRLVLLQTGYQKTTDFALFLKGKRDMQTVRILEGQGSDMMMSFALADCLIYLPPGKRILAKGTQVEIHLFHTA
jgi:molybdopterin molybdotransferase